jgi:hypothetical protein
LTFEIFIDLIKRVENAPSDLRESQVSPNALVANGAWLHAKQLSGFTVIEELGDHSGPPPFGPRRTVRGARRADVLNSVPQQQTLDL